MRLKAIHARRRGRRAGILASFMATMSLLVSAVGAAPASAQTQTAWIPLHCTIQFGPNPQPHIGAALTATFPDTVAPGEQFALEDATITAVFPPAAQIVVGPGGDALQGVVSEFWTQTTDATTAFGTTAGGNPVNSTPNLFNLVGAVQPPNQAASVVEVNGLDATRGGFQPTTPAETFSFGDIPVDSTGASGTAAGPVPGHGGGFNNLNAGTAITLPDVGPITTTGADGGAVAISYVNGPGGNLASNGLSFHASGSGNPGLYGPVFGSPCVRDTSPSAVPSPNTAFVDHFTIPIARVDGVGSASVRGTDPDADFGAGSVAAQLSGIINCDETQSTRPFIVRWISAGTTYTFTKTSVGSSRCFSGDSPGVNANAGGGEGMVNGVHATFSWILVDVAQNPANDAVEISIQPDSGNPLGIAGQLQPLNGTPGGVWVFGSLPWPPQ